MVEVIRHDIYPTSAPADAAAAADAEPPLLLAALAAALPSPTAHRSSVSNMFSFVSNIFPFHERKPGDAHFRGMKLKQWLNHICYHNGHVLFLKDCLFKNIVAGTG